MTEQTALELEISDAASATRAKIAPNRGGMVTSFEVRGRPIFFLDRASFLDETKNVRGGNPVLFPTPGKLVGDRWERAGESGVLPQHGFARNRAWEVVRSVTDSVTLRLESDPSTRAVYPWDFRVDLSYRVGEGTLHTGVEIENRSKRAMPFGFGFHPYFAIRDKTTFALESTATRAFDNVTKREVSFDARSLDVASVEVDLHVLDHGARTMSFAFDGTSKITLELQTEQPHWVLWSLPGKDFVCVEPWTCPGNAMNTGERLTVLEARETRTFSLAYRVHGPAL